MKPVMQTQRGPIGNCFAACVASILELPLDFMPNHFEDENGTYSRRWVDVWNEFLKQFGMAMMWADKMASRVPCGWSIGAIDIEGSEHDHAVVCFDGEIVHDPLGNPEDGDYGTIVRWYVFTVLDPSRETLMK